MKASNKVLLKEAISVTGGICTGNALGSIVDPLIMNSQAPAVVKTVAAIGSCIGKMFVALKSYKFIRSKLDQEMGTDLEIYAKEKVH